jgi:hypothetical protein
MFNSLIIFARIPHVISTYSAPIGSGSMFFDRKHSHLTTPASIPTFTRQLAPTLPKFRGEGDCADDIVFCFVSFSFSKFLLSTILISWNCKFPFFSFIFRIALSRASVETLSDFFHFTGFDNRFLILRYSLCPKFKLQPFVQRFLARLPSGVSVILEFFLESETVPSSFGSSTPTTWEASFWSSNSGRGKHKGKHRCIALMIWRLAHGW